MPPPGTPNSRVRCFAASPSGILLLLSISVAAGKKPEGRIAPISLYFDCSTRDVESKLVRGGISYLRESPKPGLMSHTFLFDRRDCAGGDCKFFIETGTNGGGNLQALDERHVFARLFSVELANDLFQAGKHLLHGNPRVRLYKGDVHALLPKMVADAEAEDPDAGMLFWLDAHFSGGTTAGSDQAAAPILHEVSQVLNSTRHPERHVLMMDDVRKWTGTPDFYMRQIYPKPSDVQRLICERFPASRFIIGNDTYAAYPRL